MKTRIFILLLISSILVEGCASYNTNALNSNLGVTIISQMTNHETALTKIDVAKFFCQNLTEYFNTYKYYKISSETYYEAEKQSDNATTKITKSGSFYTVEYVGAAGRYAVTFSNRTFPDADEVYTFGRLTVLGNAIRGKVYDTFTAWISKEEIALKANFNSQLYFDELNAAVEIEKWYNSLSTTE